LISGPCEALRYVFVVAKYSTEFDGLRAEASGDAEGDNNAEDEVAEEAVADEDCLDRGVGCGGMGWVVGGGWEGWGGGSQIAGDRSRKTQPTLLGMIKACDNGLTLRLSPPFVCVYAQLFDLNTMTTVGENIHSTIVTPGNMELVCPLSIGVFLLSVDFQSVLL
jgi:hypothetical protein